MKLKSGILLNKEFIIRRKVSYLTKYYVYQTRHLNLTDDEYTATSFGLYLAIDKIEPLTHIRNYLKSVHKNVSAAKVERIIKDILPVNFFKEMVTLKSNLRGLHND
jgi:hypothetical protein|tara:strand:+ start:461 stop:778 length:318 start_codon:yes stop_codon:yes gene_type:complete